MKKWKILVPVVLIVVAVVVGVYWDSLAYMYKMYRFMKLMDAIRIRNKAITEKIITEERLPPGSISNCRSDCK